MLVQNKIFATEYLMLTHLSAFTICTIVVCTSSTLNYIAYGITDIDILKNLTMA